jgi:sigma-B regulation protein RsbU (phosphoserine phosphatase)
MWYGVYKCSTRTVTYSNGGHPPPILITGDSPAEAKTSILKIPGMVVGGMPHITFEQASVHIGSYNRFYLFSDGVYEIFKPDGTMMNYEEFVEFIQNLPTDKTGFEDAQRVLAFGKTMSGNKPFSDDFSMLKIVFAPSA